MQEALPKSMLDAEILIIGVTSPLRVGVYVDKKLVDLYEKEEKTSRALPAVLSDIRQRYHLKALYYAKGPGSFMAIKVTYVMAKTLSIACDIPLYATDAFAFNGHQPIKAVGKSCFVKRGEEIVIEQGCQAYSNNFLLPEKLDDTLFDEASEPLYILPAV